MSDTTDCITRTTVCNGVLITCHATERLPLDRPATCCSCKNEPGITASQTLSTKHRARLEQQADVAQIGCLTHEEGVVEEARMCATPKTLLALADGRTEEHGHLHGLLRLLLPGLHKQDQNEIGTGDEPTVRQRRSARRCYHGYGHMLTAAAAERRVGFGGGTRRGADGEMCVYL